MTIRKLAQSLAERHRVPELARARNARSAAVHELGRELHEAAHDDSPWQRVMFFERSPDDQRIAVLRAAHDRQAAHLAALQAQLDEALREVWSACPPMEIVHRTETVIAHALAYRSVARGAEDEPFAVELENLGARVLALWAPGIDPDAVERVLGDDQARHMAAKQAVGATRPHPVLGWQPIGQAELLARAAAGLEAAGFGAARAALALQTAEYEAMAARLADARASAPLFEREHVLEAALAKEQGDVVGASETVLYALERSLGAYPPLAVYVAARTAATILRVAEGEDNAIAENGMLVKRPAAYLRAIFLAALVELRRATDAAFPGLAALVSGRERAGLRDPYRQPGHAAEPRPRAPASHRTEEAFFEELERWQLRPVVGRAMAHAMMLGALEPEHQAAEGKVGLLEHLTFWSRSDGEEALAWVRERQRWHRNVLYHLTDAAFQTVTRAAANQPLVVIQPHVVAVHMAVEALHTTPGGFHSVQVCPVLGQDRALPAIEALREVLSSHYGLSGNRTQLVHAVYAAVKGSAAPSAPSHGKPMSHGDVVETLAGALRTSDFVALVEHIERSKAEYTQAATAAGAAGAQVTVLDKLNVFSDSDAEVARDHYSEHAQLVWASMRSHVDRVNALVDGALPAYPPAQVYYGLERVRDQVAAVRATSERRYVSGKARYYCVLEGRDAALNALRHWTRTTVAIFGPLPIASEILERWVARDSCDASFAVG